ncbi:ATP phosphoribosyltransferase regulatory subunit [Candidatus Microgenomates bacterium]|nr:ATP phosphoribosyltransferase regulatory subunit [Candidatus Microgenomates bacterium]
MTQAPPTPKGFRDIKPELAKKRRIVINKIAEVLEEAGFAPMETPAIEFADTLKGKYGEEERLIYQFTDRGGRKLALRYDLTVPLARYVATYNPPLPFRAYRVGQVFRGEKPQAGRWREFTQFDFDTVGSNDPKEDALIVATVLKATKTLGIKGAVMLINDRKNFEGFPKEAVIAIDKLEKIGEQEVVKELVEKAIAASQKKATLLLDRIRVKQPTDELNKILSILAELGVQTPDVQFSPTLARGLNYYTGSIFELRISSYENLSLGAGGRYDNLIGMFSNPARDGARKQIPAVGFSFGIDRLVEILPQ